MTQYRYKQQNRWTFHIIMTCCTGGLWLLVAPFVIAWNYFRSGKKRYIPEG